MAATIFERRRGADRMAGGVGSDNYFVDNAGDRVIEANGVAGTDFGQKLDQLQLRRPAPGEPCPQGASDLNGTGNSLANGIGGNSGANTLVGNGGNDHLDGRQGNDKLYGGMGIDTLTGGAGNDTFVFNSISVQPTSNRITDFSVRDDTIGLENAIFKALEQRHVAAGAFHIGAAAHDTNDHIIYNKMTGAELRR